MKLLSVQSLRGFAAIAVVIFHALGLAAAGGVPVGPSIGAWGVDIFFVISGLVMALVTSPGDDPGAFIARRLHRIVPLYWLVTTTKVAAMLLVPAAFALKLNFMHVLTSYTFLPWQNQAGDVHPVVYVGWSLVFEVWFYIIFALVRFNVAAISVLAVACVVVGVDMIILEFIGGIAIGTALKRKNPLVPALAFCVVVVAPSSRAFAWGIPAVLTVMAFVVTERFWRAGALTKLGDASYSTYLIHPFVLPIALPALVACGMGAGIAVAGSVAAAVVVGFAVHRWVEVPLQRGLPSLLAKGRTQS